MRDMSDLMTIFDYIILRYLYRKNIEWIFRSENIPWSQNTGRIRRTYGAFTASYDYCTVSKFVRNTSRAFTLEYCAKTAVYRAILEQNARFRPISGSLRRSVIIDLGGYE